MSAVDAFPPCARRALLLGAGAAGLATLAGCGGGEDPAGPTAPAPPASEAPASTPAQGANPFDTGIAGGGDTVPAGALIETKEVPVGGGVVVRDSTLVVQPRQGTFKAFKASCPHEGVTVDPPGPGSTTIMCPGHNSQFKVADGSLVRGPATRGLSAVPVKVQNGYVVEL